MNENILQKVILIKTETGVGDEIQLTNAFQSSIQVMELHLKAITMTSATYLNDSRLQSSLLDDDEFREDLVSYMKSYIQI